MPEPPAWEDLFRTAAARGDPALLRDAVAAGLPLDDPCLHGAYTPLQYVALTGSQAALVKALIGAGADVNVRMPPKSSDAGHTALMLAAAHGRTAHVRLLLEAGADVHVADALGSTAVSEAAKGRAKGGTKAHTAVVRLLLDAGARPDAQTLQYAAWSGNPDIVQLVLDAGVDPNEPARLGLPLVWAFATKGQLGNAEVLLRAGADPDRSAATGQFAGFTARGMARGGGKAAVALLAAYPPRPGT